jgi:hypothetical protein
VLKEHHIVTSPPVGLRELAKRAGVDPGYASRVVDFLDREALVTRTTRGPITTVDWQGLLRRWSQEYSPFRRQGAAMLREALPAAAAEVDRVHRAADEPFLFACGRQLVLTDELMSAAREGDRRCGSVAA